MMENLAETLEVTPNTLVNWELSLGLNIKIDDSDNKIYSENLINLFKKVKSLILNGYTLSAIKAMLSTEIESVNRPEIETIVIEKTNTMTFVSEDEDEDEDEDETALKSLKQSLSSPNNDFNKSDVIQMFETLLKELKQYTERTIEAEKRVYLLEDFENRAKKEYFEMTSEVKQLKTQLEDKEKKLKDYEEQKKRLNLMEVQLKILQLEKNKKKPWEFWK